MPPPASRVKTYKLSLHNNTHTWSNATICI